MWVKLAVNATCGGNLKTFCNLASIKLNVLVKATTTHRRDVMCNYTNNYYCIHKSLHATGLFKLWVCQSEVEIVK